MYEVIRRKTCVSRKADRQLCKDIYRHSGSCQSAQQLIASSLSLYLRMYFCTVSELKVSEPKVSEAPHVAQLPFVHVSRTNTSEPSKSEKQTLVANSTAFNCLTYRAWILQYKIRIISFSRVRIN